MPTSTPNLVASNEQRDFFVWVNPQTFLIRANVTATGQFSSAELIDPDESLPFVRNDKFGGLVTPFLQNVTHNYGVEFNLEMTRRREFPRYPCRLMAVYLLDDKAAARKYADRHPEHVGNRVLQKVKTVGGYTYSMHDSGWIDYLRIPHFWRPERVEAVCRDYWTGRQVRQYKLTSFGKPWTAEPLVEVLYDGTVEFYDRSFVTVPPSIGTARVMPVDQGIFEDDLRTIDLGSGHASGAETLCGRVIAALKSQGPLSESVGAGYVEWNWLPALQQAGAWPLASPRQCFLNGTPTRLLDPDTVLKQKTVEFVGQGARMSPVKCVISAGGSHRNHRLPLYNAANAATAPWRWPRRAGRTRSV